MNSNNNVTESTSVPDSDLARNVPDNAKRGSGQMFESLQQTKRNVGNDAAAERRESLKDQGAPKGVLGDMWNKMTRPETKS